MCMARMLDGWSLKVRLRQHRRFQGPDCQVFVCFVSFEGCLRYEMFLTAFVFRIKVYDVMFVKLDGCFLG